MIIPRDSKDVWYSLRPGGVVATVRRRRTRAAEEPEEEQWPFQGYRSPYTGDGTPPANQPFRLRVRLGVVKTLVPSNNALEFIVTAGSTTYFFATATFNEEYQLESVELGQAAEVPEDAPIESGTSGTTSRPLFRVTADAEGITLIEPLRKDSLDVNVVVVAVACETNTLLFQWS